MNTEKSVLTPLVPRLGVDDLVVGPRVDNSSPPRIPGGEVAGTSFVARYAAVPLLMRDAKRWLVWRGEGQSRASKARKVPYYISGERRCGELDGLLDRQRLAGFAEALDALRCGGYTGLGFALGPDGAGGFWQGIDFDNLSEHPELETVIAEVPGYRERSPSGNGIHAIGYGESFNSLGSNRSGIEAYCGKRFFTVTGQKLEGSLVDLQSFVTKRLTPLHTSRNRRVHASPPDIAISRDQKLRQVDPEISSDTLDELRCALQVIPASEYEMWVKVGLALSGLGENGKSLWMKWSATSSKFDANDAEEKWQSFSATSIGYKSVFAYATDWGWCNPKARSRRQGSPLGSASVQNAVETPGLREKIIDLAEMDSVTAEHHHIVDRLIPAEEVTLFAGHGGSGKSYVSLLIAVLVCLGRDIAGLSVSQRNVLFFSGEDPKQELLRRLNMICQRHGVHVEAIKDRLVLIDASDIDATLYLAASSSRQRGEVTESVNKLAELACEIDAGLIIVDNASETFSDNENDRSAVRCFIRGLRIALAGPERAVLLLCHVSKSAAHSTKGQSQDYSGSTAWHNSARSRLSLDPAGKNGVGELRHQKNNRGRLAQTIDVHWVGGVPELIPSPHSEFDSDAGRQAAEGIQMQLRAQQSEQILQFFMAQQVSGQVLRTARTGSHCLYANVKKSKNFPRGVSSKGFWGIVDDLEANARIYRQEIDNGHRKLVEVYCVAGGPGQPLSESVVKAVDGNASSEIDFATERHTNNPGVSEPQSVALSRAK